MPATASAAPARPHSPRTLSFPSPSLAENWPAEPWDAPRSPPAIDDRGRQRRFIESMAQRRERVEFLRRREWTRRIADWVHHRAAQTPRHSIAHTPYAWAHILAALDALPLDDAPPPDSERGDPDPDPDHDHEPYVIYTASPRRTASPARTDTPSPRPALDAPALAPAPTLTPQRRRTRCDPRSRHSSLSSICEEDELAPCP
ncbi:hypothetical protein B0H21DRAFT_823544 [Amylocystis lapponica]|nr:hypothetical protein B0H21DRAFT_823544 [Amylocystis lapponica]